MSRKGPAELAEEVPVPLSHLEKLQSDLVPVDRPHHRGIHLDGEVARGRRDLQMQHESSPQEAVALDATSVDGQVDHRASSPDVFRRIHRAERHRQPSRKAPVFPMRATMHSPVECEKPMVTELTAKREDQDEREQVLKGSPPVGPANKFFPALRAARHCGSPESSACGTGRSRSRPLPP